ncbi:MAG: hypothetical protein ABII82_15525 [Verrucomicrobiota bacterium]
MRPSGLRSGFALLITITLVAFLVLVLVSLATLTRVETRVAANGQQLAQARSNALYALNLAVGQLQQHAGPDQAVTARADIDTANTENPRWTGVWDAVTRDSAGVALTTPTHAVAPSSNAPLAWLVSGNEQNGVAITPASAAVDDPADSNDNVWLLRTALGRSLEADAANPVDGRIKLAKSAINAAARDVPGMDASSTDPVRLGSYAWWVGDEGIKAKVNLTDPYSDASSTDEESAWRREAAPRPDLTLLSKPEFAGAFSGSSATLESARGRLLSDGQLVLLSSDLASGDGLEQAGGYYHDLTLVGRGVLADTLRGGLRRDLTRGLAASPASGSVAASEIGDALPVFTLPAPGPVGRTAPTQVWTSNREPPAPEWGMVRSYWSRRATAAGVLTPQDAAFSVSPATSPSDHAFLPIPVMVQLGYGIDGSGANYRFVCKPRIVLCNPYNVALSAASYEVTYRPTNATLVRFSFSPASAGGEMNFPSPAARVTTTFVIAADAFQPGEVRVYTPVADTAFDPATDSTIPMAAGFRDSSVYYDSGYVVDPAHQLSTSTVRVLLNTYTASQHPEITLGLAGGAPGQRIRWVELENARMGLESYKGATVAKPRGFVNSPADTRELLALRFHLRDATTDINTAGNQPGTQNHQVPGGHPARRSDGGTIGDSSGTRMLVDNNPRAIMSQRLGGWDSVAHFAFDPVRGADLLFPYDGDNGFWGGGVEGDAFSSTHVVLFDVLRDGEEVVSLGRLGHVNWGVDGKHPAYPLGNSFASIFYPHDAPDYGYALNEALWDRFFLSTLPATLSTRPARLPNTRMVFHDPAGGGDVTALEGTEGYELAATRLMIDGAFNINSTSVEAWTAFLGSVQESDYRYSTRSGPRTDEDVRPFPRLRAGHDPDPSRQTGNLYEWTGYRRLDTGQLRSLATAIVSGIKARGRPARSLAEFMNRDLARPATDTLNQAGLVQAGINAVINTDGPDASGNGMGLSVLGGLNTVERVADTFANADNPDAARGKLRTTGAPGFLLQNDLLTPLAPAMSARSDTFRVRAYGEARNPATGEIIGEAWCEAVVQRLPEYVGGEAAELSPAALAPGSESARFGRKFIVTSFRWLTSEDL